MKFFAKAVIQQFGNRISDPAFYLAVDQVQIPVQVKDPNDFSGRSAAVTMRQAWICVKIDDKPLSEMGGVIVNDDGDGEPTIIYCGTIPEYLFPENIQEIYMDAGALAKKYPTTPKSQSDGVDSHQ